MRFAHLSPRSTAGREPAGFYVVDGHRVLPVGAVADDAPRDLQELIERGDGELQRLRAAVAAHGWNDAADLSGFEHAPAVSRPPSIIAIGLNYGAHASELNLDMAAAPTVFAFWPSSLAPHEGTTSWPESLSSEVDYEAELGVIIGKPAKDVSIADALDHVFGYTIVNDITARNVQFSEAQWIRCKSFDGFTPVGPVVVTADEVPDPQDLRLGTVLDGRTVQDSSTSEMIHSVAKLISVLSQSTTLLPGTLISTGSPAGAGYSRKPQIFLKNHSTVTIWIDGIGQLTTHCRVIGE
ncbi:fumarylacetoacetate hydrolase family protein [Herbiconiux sp. CPCC 205763]|uniref:Fumarylacetoacetate hydrolase family protein n=1 Tax=Herbiconiux aconitum TaxID=2970913 RepID=A0ABT2GTX9_9MICO|nr:fumarylacetoacetate hydrolase family protein [Herbiconiux aconitum]MCS5719660.1 fumarylacetoacetate hydrolase family protein [Herbiconiux aconitum]